jgi:spermidine synthase
MTKVTIPAEIADAIEYLRKDCHVWDDAIILNCFDGGYYRTTCCIRQLLGKYALQNPAVLASAIVNGYEREMTDEERAHAKVREKYDYYRGDMTYGEAFCDGMKFVLNSLNVKIAGVNVGFTVART